MIQDRQTIKAKAAAMSAIMRNPKLSSVISDAWVAPPGSTVNQKAKNVLKSLHTANNNYLYAQDGRGGTSDFSYNPTAYPSNFIGPLPQDATRAAAPTTSTLPAVGMQGDLATPAPMPSKWQIAIGSDDALPESYLNHSKVLGQTGTTVSPQTLSITLDRFGKLTTPDLYNKQQSDEWGDYMRTTYQNIDKNTVAASLFGNQLATQGEMTGNLLLQGGLPAGATMPTYKNWVPQALGYIDTEGSFKPYDALELMGKDPQAVGALQQWLMSDPKEGKTILDFMKPDSNFLSLASLLQDYTPMEREVLKNKFLDPNYQWTQEDTDKFYLDLISNKSNPDPDIWGEGVKSTDITDEAIRAKVEEMTGFSPTKIGEGPVQDDGNLSPETLKLTADLAGVPALTNFLNALPPDLQSYYKIAYENAVSGKGRAGFIRQAFGDQEFMDSLGVPKEVVDLLPKSGLLSEHLLDLKESIKKQYGLDELLNKINTMEEQGYTVVDDMKAYIRGKDEYLAQIEKLTEDAETKYANMDTSNPYVDARMKNYLNYLNIIHGRQNQRYVDYLNSSYDRYNNRIDQLNRRYESAFKQAEEEYNDLSVISKEAYESIKGQLDRVYDLVEQEIGSYETMTEDAIARLQAAENLKKTTLDNKLKQLDIDNYGKKDVADVKWNDVNSLLMAEKDKDGVISIGVTNPFEAYTMAEQANMDPDVVVNNQRIWMKQLLQQEISSGNITDAVKGAHADLVTSYNETKSGLEYLKSNIDEAFAEEYAGSDYTANELAAIKQNYASTLEQRLMAIETIYQTSLKMIEDTVSASLRDNFAKSPTFAEDVREAMKNLTGVGMWNKEEDDKTEFVGKYQDKIGAQIAGVLYDSYWKSRGGGLKKDEVFVYRDNSGEEERIIPLWEVNHDTILTNQVADMVFKSILS